MILPNNCYCSPLKVHPRNWNYINASTRKNWYIYYRFYDPTFKDHPKYKKGKLVIIKGMNHLKIVSQRQAQTRKLIEAEKKRLLEEKFNPMIVESSTTKKIDYHIEPSTDFLTALEQAKQLIHASDSTIRDLKSILGFIRKAAIQLNYHQLQIKTISRKHIKVLLNQIQTNQESESPHRYNKVRSYLIMLFNELVDFETVDSNPAREISKKTSIQRLRKLLNPEKRKQINNHLKTFHYRFWIFTNIFFHSGARLTEMVNIKRQDVDLKRMIFKVTINKGKFRKEVEKPIKYIALHFWVEAIKNAGDEDYLFAKGLEPGKVSIKSYQLTKRWNRHIKKKLGIDEDFYSLKHLNLDETSALLGINDAAAMASHSTIATTVKHYTVNENFRQGERLKAVNNSFA